MSCSRKGRVDGGCTSRGARATQKVSTQVRVRRCADGSGKRRRGALSRKGAGRLRWASLCASLCAQRAAAVEGERTSKPEGRRGPSSEAGGARWWQRRLVVVRQVAAAAGVRVGLRAGGGRYALR